jgi:2'-5' RNA ligase
VSAWQAGELRGGRTVPAANLHLTLAFLGSTQARELGAVAAALTAAASASHGIRLSVDRYRETRSVGMLSFRDKDGAAGALASSLAGALEQLGLFRREQRPWLAHLTVLRFTTRPHLDPPLPELGTIVPSDAAVFMSSLHPEGAHYEVLEAMPLGG